MAEDVARWGVTRGRSRIDGVHIAGFRDRFPGAVDVRVVPHPAVTVAVAFGDGPLVVDSDTGRRQRGDLVAGFMHGALRVRGANVECVQVRMSPVVAYAVLGVSPAELAHVVVPLDDLWGRVAEPLRDARTWGERFALTDTLLAHRLVAGPAVDREVAWAWRRIVASRGRVRVDSLVAEAGWSRKRMWTRFRAQIGLAPKQAAKLVRFDHAVHRLATGEAVARTAAESGYVDQSHLHRDVRAFTGVTPAALAGEPWLAVDGVAWVSGGSAPVSSGAAGASGRS